ncbi:MAG TPA: hypothetical protein VK791_08185 [bacterium]|jgi:hypothetical protein|nr:hypothetical protein [bacterium]
MTRSKIGFSLILVIAFCFLTSCKKSASPSDSGSSNPNPNNLYLTVFQNSPSCPFTITVTGPTTFTDVIGGDSLRSSQIATNYVSGSYTFAFNGVSDGAVFNLSGSEAVTCIPLSTTGCPGWSYTVKP